MKNIQNYILGIGIAMMLTPTHAQQESQFGNYIHNPYIFNPAAGGLTDVTQFDLGYRNQYIGSSGNPSTIYLSGHTQISKKGNYRAFNTDRANIYGSPDRSIGALKHIVGGKMMNDKIGPFQKTSIYGSYAVHLPLTEKMNMGLGLSAGWGNFQINPNEVILHNPIDNTYAQFAGQVSKQNNLDVQTGLVLYTNRFLFSVSGTQLLNSKTRINSIETLNTLNPHLFIISSYRFSATEKLDVEPFIMLKGVKGSPVNLDFGARFKYNKSIWLGAQYRTSNSFVISAGLNFLRNFNVSYAFEYGAKSTRISTAGTHEIQLGILLGKSVRNIDKEINQSKKKQSSSSSESEQGEEK